MTFLRNLLITVLFITSPMAFANENPYELLQQVATKTFDTIKTNQAQIKEDPNYLKSIVEKELLPYVDYRFAGAKVLGKHFKSIAKDKEKMATFFEVFRKYLIATYAVALSQYDDQQVFFEPAKDFAKKKSVTVRAIIKDESRPDIKIAFQVRKSSKTKEWKAYDMVAEGISMVSSKRSEFESILRQEGVDKVIAIMQEKNNQSIKLKSEDADAS